MALHVDVVENKWSAGKQRRVAEVRITQGEIHVDGDAHWVGLVRDALLKLEGDAPDALLRALVGHFNSDYAFATEPHDHDACPFTHGNELPFEEAPAVTRQAQP